MAVSPLFLLLFSLFSVCPSAANLRKTDTLLFESETLSKRHQNHSTDIPTRYFEVTKPLSLPPNAKSCSYLLLQHSFGYTYGKPPVTAPYNPPTSCPFQSFSKISLTWSAYSKGRQFDRIFGVWLSGVELLRSCTAEPRATGTVWTVEKDITRYYSLLQKPQTLAVYLGNLVDRTYTGIYDVNVTINFYTAEKNSPKLAKSGIGFSFPADLILPISRNLPLNDGQWFVIENSTDIQVKDFKVPTNAYRAILEVFLSFHSNDEFWYTNPPNDYIEENNLTGLPGNGPFRELVISLDGQVVGAVWPFTVIYTGGVNPLLWRPITGIGSFDLPTYDIEITPFLGRILDGQSHDFGFSVTAGLSFWYVDANLHLWLDDKSDKTEGKLIKYKAEPFRLSLVENFEGLDGSFFTTASRQIASSGWVKSSYGKITTHSFQGFDYMNSMVFGNNGTLQVVNQTIDDNYGVYAKYPSSVAYTIQVFRRFPLYLYTANIDQGNNTYSSVSNVSFGIFENRYLVSGIDSSFSSLSNKQDALGYMLVKGNLVVSGVGSTQQEYQNDSIEGCYYRNVSASNYTILYDKSGVACSDMSRLGSGFGSRGRLPSSSRRVPLSYHLHSQKKRN